MSKQPEVVPDRTHIILVLPQSGGMYAIDEGYDNGRRVGGFRNLDEVMEYCLDKWIGSTIQLDLGRFQNEDGSPKYRN